MSLPIVITTCSRLMMDIADFTMITTLGDAAQGAIMPAQLIMWTFVVLGMGTVGIVNTFVSQSLGRERPAETSAYAWQGVYLSFGYGVACLGLYTALPQIIQWTGHHPDIAALELAYCRAIVFAIGPTIACEALAGFFNGVQRPVVTMWTAIEANVLNVIVSMTLIFGVGPFPEMGIAGAGWGTVCGVSFRFVRLLIAFLSPHYHGKYASRNTWRLDGTKLRAIVRMGIPQGLQWLSDVLVWMLFTNFLIGRLFEPAHLIASNVSWQFMRIGFMPAIGVGIAVSSLVGKAIGAGDPDRAMRYTKWAVWILLGYLGALSGVYMIYRADMIALFNPDPEIIRIGSAIMVCAVIFQMSDALGITYNAALRGAGDTFWPAIIFVVSHWVIVIGGGLSVALLKPEWGSIGPWSAATFLLIFLGFALWWRWHSRAWQKINLFAHEGESAARLSGENNEIGHIEKANAPNGPTVPT